jgi:uncharacterized protein (DUF2384 family)
MSKMKSGNRPSRPQALPRKTSNRLPAKAGVALKDFDYTEFRSIADATPFSIAEWAVFLHLSERTLQRYAKSNGVFGGMQAERALQIERLVKEGKQTLGSEKKFYQWLQSAPVTLEGSIGIESLSSNDGIQQVHIELKRIQHGLLA